MMMDSTSFPTQYEIQAAAAADGGGDAKKQRFSKFGKDPTVMTDFLPDRDRALQQHKQREKLKEQWLKEQEKTKAEQLQVTYSYWDGSGHRQARRRFRRRLRRRRRRRRCRCHRRRRRRCR